jgi:uncharacterized protein (TIGR03032 family)
MTPLVSAPSMPQIEVRVHGDFVAWLAGSRGALAVTTYNSGKLALYAAPGGVLQSCIVKLSRPMGLAYDAGRLAVATREHIHLWTMAAENHVASQFPALASWKLAAVHATGRLDAHELAFDARGLCFANTRYNCVARPSERVRFRRAWRPPFMPAGVSRDACHLNGVGVRSGRVAMVTAFCDGSVAGSWRAGDRFTSGVVVDVRRNRVAVRGLCMPHSPRWDGRRWWLCNSGEGALCTFDPRVESCDVVAMLPGFSRGLCFAAGRAVVGLSRIRRSHILDAPPVRSRVPTLRSGLWLVDPLSGGATGALEFVRGGREVFDVAFVPQAVAASRCIESAAP